MEESKLIRKDIKMKLPESYVERMKELLKDEFDDYIKSFEEKNHQGLRANTLKIEPEELKEKLPFDLEPIPWCKEGFYYSSEVRPAKHPYYYAGLFYIQEPSAMSTGAMLPINEGDRIADLCAAPGGKSTQAAAKLKGSGILVTNDISATRCKALLKNVEISGLNNAIVTNEDPIRLADRFEGFFNKIIVDAPCSGEGMFRKDNDAIKSWEEHKSEMCCSLQRQILNAAAKMLCDDGIIAYSTCTFAPEENEGSINEFLDNHPEFEIIEVDKTSGFCDGHPEWVEGGREELKKCARLWPYKIKGEGHFLTLLHKKGDKPYNEPSKIKDISKDKRLEEFYSFSKECLNIDINSDFEIHGSSLFKIPYGIDLRGLRVVRSGLYLGELKTKRFEPSQAFAMTLKKEDVKNYVDFSLEDERVIRYLKGESFEAEAKDGWCLVMVDGYPLGWAKAQKGRLKNKYLAGWRM